MENHDSGRLHIALAGSLALHLLIFALPLSLSAPPLEEPLEPIVVELVRPPRPVEPPQPVVESPQPVVEPPPRPLLQPRKVASALRPRRALAAPRPTLTETAPDDVGELPPEHPERSEPISLPPDPRDEPRGEAITPLGGLDEAGQGRRRVEERIGEIAREALPPPINDPPAYPELIRDEEGNFTWFFYKLVANIRPDGTVFFTHRPPPSDRRTGRYCLELADAPDRCQELSTVPWPEDWGNPAGSFPENPIKMWFLRRTQPFRDRLTDLWQRQTLATSMSAVQRNADRIWRDEALRLPAKRRLIFELWDECEEPRDDDDDRAVAKVGQQAREQILEYVRRALPPGSPDAYSTAELRRLNARRVSKQPFDPY